MTKSNKLWKCCYKRFKLTTIAVCIIIVTLNLTVLMLTKSLPSDKDDGYRTTIVQRESTVLHKIPVTSAAGLVSVIVRTVAKVRNVSTEIHVHRKTETNDTLLDVKPVLQKRKRYLKPVEQINRINDTSKVQYRTIKARDNNTSSFGEVNNGIHVKRKPKAAKEITNYKDFIQEVEVKHANLKINQTAFGSSYTPSKQRTSVYDFQYIIPGDQICSDVEPFLVIMVLSVHTHIDTRDTIRQTWGRAATPGIWPKLGKLIDTVKLIFLLGRGDKEIKNKIVDDENKHYGDIVQADFIDSYFNLTRKVVTGLRWVAEFCPKAKYILKADEDVFVHVPNLIEILKKQTVTPNGAVFGHLNQRSKVLREGKWAVSKRTYPLAMYPPYVAGNTYVISGHIASRMFYVAGHLPYMNIEDVFVCGIVRTMIRADIHDVIGFTHWYERKPKACEFKNNRRVSSTKTDDSLKMYIWEEQKTKLENCYHVMKRNVTVPVKRPEDHIQNRPSFRHSIRDEHIFLNKTNGQFYVL